MSSKKSEIVFKSIFGGSETFYVEEISIEAEFKPGGDKLANTRHQFGLDSKIRALKLYSNTEFTAYSYNKFTMMPDNKQTLFTELDCITGNSRFFDLRFLKMYQGILNLDRFHPNKNNTNCIRCKLTE